MLSHEEGALVAKALAALAKCQCGNHAELIAGAADMLSRAAQARQAMSEAATARGANNTGDARKKLYTVEAAPGWEGTALGVEAAVAMVNEELTKHKLRPVTIGTVRVTLARAAEWSRMVETDNGTVVYSIRKAPETGTDLASAQSEHKSETNPELGTTERKRRSRK